jgi:hypothetical protein
VFGILDKDGNQTVATHPPYGRFRNHTPPDTLINQTYFPLSFRKFFSLINLFRQTDLKFYFLSFDSVILFPISSKNIHIYSRRCFKQIYTSDTVRTVGCVDLLLFYIFNKRTPVFCFIPFKSKENETKYCFDPVTASSLVLTFWVIHYTRINKFFSQC